MARSTGILAVIEIGFFKAATRHLQSIRAIASAASGQYRLRS
jgi:hypothetical protein